MKRRVKPALRRRRSVLVVAAAACCALTGTSIAGAHAGLRGVSHHDNARHDSGGSLGHAGRWIVDGTGRVVVMHGFNLVAKVAPYEPAAAGFGADDARFLVRHGFTAVRLGVIPEAVEPKPDHFDNHYLASIRATMRLLARHGIRSLLDFHQDLYNQKFQGEGLPAWMIDDDGLPVAPKAGFPANYFVMPALQVAFDNLWDNAPGPGGIGLRTRYAQLVGHVARYFSGDPGVLGYDVFNEPDPGTNFLTCFPPLGCPGFDRAKLAPFMAASIRAIHAADPHQLAFYEPALPFDYGAPTGLANFSHGEVGMSFHDYCLGALGLPSTPVTQPVCDLAVESRVITNALAQAKVSGDALMLTEFGASTDLDDLAEITGLARAHDISWLEWAYCDCGDPTGSGHAESLVYNPAKPPRGANVNHVTLATLDSPYAQLVSGTPEGSTYDAATGRFAMHYSTRAPGGRQFGAGARSRIYTSPLHYPHGYRVQVAGGRVVSAPNARVLVVAAKRGVATVSVALRRR